jgi:hypothetical protein
MTFTYTGNPLTSTIDEVRAELGDTMNNQHEMEDEEILYAYTKEGSAVRAAARCCEMLAARYAKREGFRGGTIQTEKTTISGKYKQMAKLLRARGISAGSFIVPSTSIAAKQDNELNTDAPKPSIKRGFASNPEISGDADDSDMDLRVSGST